MHRKMQRCKTAKYLIAGLLVCLSYTTNVTHAAPSSPTNALGVILDQTFAEGWSHYQQTNGSNVELFGSNVYYHNTDTSNGMGVIAYIGPSHDDGLSINIAAHFPDPNFRAFVEEFMGVGPGGDFTAEEAADKTGTMDCSNRDIADLSGIEFFTGITNLRCSGNLLTALDVSGLTSLQILNCSGNKLTNLNVSGLGYLKDINCNNNQLTALDVTSLLPLERLSCSGNLLTDLTVSGTTNLWYLNFGNNQIGSINLTGLGQLKEIHGYNNRLTSLNVFSNTGLIKLDLSRNLLTQLDVSGLPNLQLLVCSDNDLTDIQSFVTNTALGTGDSLVIDSNRLGLDDWHDIEILKQRGFAQFVYNPQKSIDFEANINTAANFPHTQFRSFVEEFLGISSGGSFNIVDAAFKTGTMDCSNRSITDLTGITFFQSITNLKCSGNLLTTLDVSALANLEILTCLGNRLTSLNVAGLSSLKEINCNNNKLTALDVSSLSFLERLNCTGNMLTDLTVAGANNLLYLNFGNNLLSGINLSGLSQLRELHAYNNQLQSLIVSSLSSLTKLDLTKNALAHLDVTDLTGLQLLSCSDNQLTDLQSFVANAGLGARDYFFVQNNRLDCYDWPEIANLEQRGFALFEYSPQIGISNYNQLACQPPSVLSVFPAENSSDAAWGADITVTYDQTVNSISAQPLVIHGRLSGKRNGTLAGNGTATLTFDPDQDFYPGETVEITATRDTQNANGILSTPYVWLYQAEAGIGPGVYDAGERPFGTGRDGTQGVALGDYNGDGHLDVALANNFGETNEVYFNDGSGVFTSHLSFGSGGDSGSIALGDLDGDGDLDLVVGNGARGTGQPNYIYLNDGGGNFSDARSFGPGNDPTRVVALGDVDGDGDLDIAVGNFTGYGNAVYFNDGSAFFSAGTPLGTGSDNTLALALGDMDNDGDLDAVVGNNGEQNAVYLNDGSGSFTDGTIPFGTGLDNTSSLALGDIDNDGDLDIAIGNNKQQNAVYLNDGAGQFSSSLIFGDGSYATLALALGDIDGDGDLDLAAGHGNMETNVVYRNDGAGNYNTVASTFGIRACNSLSFGDIDGDGDVDLASGNSNQQNAVHLNAAPPIAPDIDISVQEDNGVNLVLSGNVTDADGNLDASSLIVFTSPAHGTATSNGDGSIHYTPHSDFNGSDSFVYQICDTDGLCAKATVRIQVTPVNDPPQAGGAKFAEVNEDQSLTIPPLTLLSDALDVDGDSLSVLLDQPPSHAGYFAQSLNGSIAYTPELNYHGLDSFTYRVSDGIDVSAPVTVTVTVHPVNDPPSNGGNKGYGVNEDQNLVISAGSGVLSGAQDIDGDSLHAILVQGPVQATFFTLNLDGSFSYTPQLNFNGGDSFSYKLSDGQADSSITIANINITPVNDAPHPGSNKGYKVVEGNVLQVDSVSGVLNDAYDVDGNPITAVLVASPQYDPNFVLLADGSFTYTPNASGLVSTLLDTFTYTVFDGIVNAPNRTVTLSISPLGVTSQETHVVTDTGENVSVQVVDEETGESAVELNFSAISESGVTTVTKVDVTEVPEEPVGLKLGDQIYEIDTTATFYGPVVLSFKYDETKVDETTIRLMHYENNAWVDVTTLVDTAINIIYGAVTSFSPVAIMSTDPSPRPELVLGENIRKENRHYIVEAYEGMSLTLDAGESRDPNNSILTFSWDLDDDGVFEAEGMTQTLHFSDDTDMWIHLRASNHSSSDVVDIHVIAHNAPPVVDDVPDYLSLEEGSLFTKQGIAFTDPGKDSYTVNVDWGDSSATETYAFAEPANSGVIPPLSHVYADNGNYSVTITVEDDDGGIASDQFWIAVTNKAPLLFSVTGLPVEPIPVGTQVTGRAEFSDAGTGDTHTATWVWDTYNPTLTTTITDTITRNGSIAGSVSGSYTYNTPGIYTVELTVTDDDGVSSDSVVYQYVVVYDPTGGFVTGGGWIDSPAGAYALNPNLSGKVHFNFVSKYQKGANVPIGNTEFQFKTGNFTFKSTEYEWLVVAGANAKYKGTGTVNGQGDYGFMLTAVDGQVNGGGGVDKFRIKIWDKATGVVVYDNQPGETDDSYATTELSGGSIVVHTK